MRFIINFIKLILLLTLFSYIKLYLIKSTMIRKYSDNRGCGFIGSNFLNIMVPKYKNIKFHNIDKITYAGKTKNLNKIRNLITIVFQN